VYFLFNSYVAFFTSKSLKLCGTIIIFNLIRADPDVKIHRLLPKNAKNVLLLITFDAPMTTGITCVFNGHIRSIFIFSTVFLIS